MQPGVPRHAYLLGHAYRLSTPGRCSRCLFAMSCCSAQRRLGQLEHQVSAGFATPSSLELPAPPRPPLWPVPSWPVVSPPHPHHRRPALPMASTSSSPGRRYAHASSSRRATRSSTTALSAAARRKLPTRRCSCCGVPRPTQTGGSATIAIGETVMFCRRYLSVAIETPAYARCRALMQRGGAE